MKPKVPVVYRCPRNGEPVRCEVCKAPIPHQVEELVRPGAKWLPSCETHGVRMVPA